MNRIWIYALFICAIVTACSDDVTEATEESSNSSSIEIIEITPTEESSSSISRPLKNVIYFSYKAEEKSSSSEKKSSSSNAKSSSSSKPNSSSAISSSEESSSSIASSSSSIPKSSASLRFYDCKEYDCVTMEYLNPKVSYGELLDKRNNKVYSTVVISNNVWTAQNIDFKTENDSIAQSWCYNNDTLYCQKYGRLYNWEAAQKACPEGWRLPTADDWFELIEDHTCEIEINEGEPEYYHCSGTLLKAIDTWQDGLPNTNEHGFSVIAAGIGVPDGFNGEGSASKFWTSTDPYQEYAGFVDFGRFQDYTMVALTYKYYGLSVRCIKGNPE